ncbi:MAG: uracil-DNA glycosylase [Anaeromyxobacter sp.]|nr:uracil-DNA glycosylase [Anaeromyxobacter sp.]MBL0275122.1 uracil-DNA glycosylase [Anaeromyxobacter sp.]
MRSPAAGRTEAALRRLQRELAAFHPPGFGPTVHGPPVVSGVFLLGQAPGPHEAALGRPFAWTAGKTLFRWLERATGAGEALVRERVYISAVARGFPGKARGGGDRVPTPDEIALWRPFVAREVALLRPRLVVPIGRLAIGEVLGERPLAEVVGRSFEVTWHGVATQVVPLPHPSGASTWYKVEPGRALTERALELLGRHPELRRCLAAPGRP